MKYVDESIMSIYEADDFKIRALSNSLNPRQINLNNMWQFTLLEVMVLCGILHKVLPFKEIARNDL